MHRVWAFPSARPVAPVQHRYQWRYLTAFVYPASGRTVWFLLSEVSTERFAAVLAAFARSAGAGPDKELVLVLDGAGWHTSPHLPVPDHVHLLILPPYSPELNPAEHLWPLTDTVLANRHFASIEELEQAQAERCIALLGRRSHPLDDLLPLVAPAHPQTPTTQLKLILPFSIISGSTPGKSSLCGLRGTKASVHHAVRSPQP